MNKRKVQKALAKKGLSQRGVAELVGISPTMFSKYMNNRNTMRVDIAIKTAGVLGMTVEELFGGDGE